jgi:hypothetical protein
LFDVRTRLQKYLLVLIPILLLIGVGCWLAWRFLYGPGDLLEAAERGEMRKAALLTHLGVRPDSDIFLVGGLMHCAAAKGETQAMARLLELGANVNRLDGIGATPAHAAVFGRNLESFRWLFARGADPLDQGQRRARRSRLRHKSFIGAGAREIPFSDKDGIEPAGWSERKAAVQLRDKSDVSGGCLPSLTLIVRQQRRY